MGDEANGPLLSLEHRLRRLGPPSLSVLIARLEEIEEYEDFMALVREFLLEHEREILGRPGPAGQIAAFADRFEDRYFPLREDMRGLAENYSDLTGGIPVMVMGLSWEDYHYIASDWRLGFQLMTYLLTTPAWTDDGARVPLEEACAEDVPADLLRQVPEGGLPPAEAHRLLQGTPYEGLACWADMLEWNTGNYFLDTSDEDLWNEGLPDWSRETVEALTGEWQQAEAIQGKVLRLVEWLEENPPGHFRELLECIERRGNE